MINLATAEETKSARIKQSENNIQDLNVTLVDSNAQKNSNILDPILNTYVDGYVFKGNTECKITLTNTKGTFNPIVVRNYYFDSVDQYNFKVLNEESKIKSDSIYKIIPDTTLNSLNKTNRLKNKIFLLECEYELMDDNQNIEKKVQNIYFKLLSDSEYDNLKSDIKNKQDSVVKPK